jgi:hypothetical protein
MVLTTTQAQNLDPIAQLWTCQRQQSRCKEHSLIVGMSYEQQDALVLQGRKGGANGARIQPEAEQNDGRSSPEKQIHGVYLDRVAITLCASREADIAGRGRGMVMRMYVVGGARAMGPLEPFRVL